MKIFGSAVTKSARFIGAAYLSLLAGGLAGGVHGGPAGALLTFASIPLLLVGVIFAAGEILIHLSRTSLWTWAAFTLGVLPFILLIFEILTN